MFTFPDYYKMVIWWVQVILLFCFSGSILWTVIKPVVYNHAGVWHTETKRLCKWEKLTLRLSRVTGLCLSKTRGHRQDFRNTKVKFKDWLLTIHRRLKKNTFYPGHRYVILVGNSKFFSFEFIFFAYKWDRKIEKIVKLFICLKKPYMCNLL